MRIRISHDIELTYDRPASQTIQVLRVTPRSHAGQYVIDWRVDVSADCRMVPIEDPFGNLSHTFSVDGPLEALTINIAGEVETEDTSGVIRSSVDRLPASLFLRETPLTMANDDIRAFADKVASGSRDQLAVLHALNDAINERIRLVAPKIGPEVTAGVIFSARQGQPRDLAHLFLVAARHLGIPARFVNGYYYDAEKGATVSESRHSWVEARVPHLGWVGFDPTLACCPGDSHVRVASGLDHPAVMAIRASAYGTAEETLTMSVRVEADAGIAMIDED
ncbi:transglutaminase family protein [Segnochrobactraceae bacterium EtOH-i3]